MPEQEARDTVSRHDRENAARDLARDLLVGLRAITPRLAWVDEGSWPVDHTEQKFDLIGPDGLAARVTVHVSGTLDYD